MMPRLVDVDEGPIGVGSPRAATGRTPSGERKMIAPAIPDLRRLYAFIVVAEELHFRHAAKRLVMAQSPLSRLIKGLERDVGALLFVRSRRRVELTGAGEALLHDAREIFGLTERAVQRARRSSARAGKATKTPL